MLPKDAAVAAVFLGDCRDLHSFMNNQYGLVNTSNPCRCPAEYFDDEQMVRRYNGQKSWSQFAPAFFDIESNSRA
jgi:hypothetical protein